MKLRSLKNSKNFVNTQMIPKSSDKTNTSKFFRNCVKRADKTETYANKLFENTKLSAKNGCTKGQVSEEESYTDSLLEHLETISKCTPLLMSTLIAHHAYLDSFKYVQDANSSWWSKIW